MNAGIKDQPVTPVTKCPICGAEGMSVFWERTGLPVLCNVLFAKREDALGVPRGDIRLTVCKECGFVCNDAFDPGLLEYDQTYENSLHFSPRFQDYAESQASRLVVKYDLHGKDIIEIACGKGDFLRLLCRMGGNRGVGFDPSCDPQADHEEEGGRVTLIADVFSRRYAGSGADLICCRHALEHIPAPAKFLQGIHDCFLGCDRKPAVFFEVPYAMYTLRDLGIWDIIYEHCSYFCAASLARCFSRAGFAVTALSVEYDEQFLTIEAGMDGERYEPCPLTADHAEVINHSSTFSRRFDEKLESLRRRIDGSAGRAAKTVVWGAGSKGVTFLNLMGGSADVDYVVDVNPRKHGMYVSGTGQEIIEPGFLSDYRPARIIVMNPIYLDEIRAMLGRLDLTAEIITV